MIVPSLDHTLRSLMGIPLETLDSTTISTFEVRLPVEIIWTTGEGTSEFTVGPPRWRWRTDFDREPGWLEVRFTAGAVES